MKRLLVAILIVNVFFFSSCSDDEEPKVVNEYHETVIDYFKSVALGFELGSATKVTRKWSTDMKLFVGGEMSSEMEDELDVIIDELNDLTAADGFSISIVDDTLQANSYVFFGSGQAFAERVTWAASHVASNWGLFYVNFDNTNHITAAWIYVDIFRATDPNARKHLLREELTQSLGLARDSGKFPESIFQSSWTLTTGYADIDRDLIRLLYNPGMSTGLNESQVDPVLRQLVVSLNVGG